MKIKLLVIGLMLFSVTGITQGTIIEKYFEKYAEDESFTKVTVNSKMFSLFTELDANTASEEDFLEAVSKLKGLKILASDSIEDSAHMFEFTCNDIDNAGYEELMTVEDAHENMKFSIKEKNGRIEELIMVVGGNKNFVLLSLYGEIDLKNISKIARSMNINGLEHLNRMENAEKE